MFSSRQTSVSSDSGRSRQIEAGAAWARASGGRGHRRCRRPDVGPRQLGPMVSPSALQCQPPRASSPGGRPPWLGMQLALPVAGHSTGRPGDRLVDWVMAWPRQGRTVQDLFPRVVPEPVLARLVTLDDGVPHRGRMVARVLGRRGVAAADVTAMRATAEVEPPTTCCEALDAPRAAGSPRGIDRNLVGHRSRPFLIALSPAADAPCFPVSRSVTRRLRRGLHGRQPRSGPDRDRREPDLRR
jgi:hypothetical protein